MERTAPTTRILVSSFGPFASNTVNASAQVARRLWEEGIEGADLVAVELPVVRYDASHMLVEAFDRVRPDLAVMLGIAENRDRITPERVAINVDDYRIPDNAGNQPVDEPIVPGAPAAYFTTLPVKQIVAALDAASIAAEVSNTAGTYLCNHVAYALLHHVERTGAPCSAGFVHIPQMREVVAPGAPSMPFADLVRGVTIAVRTAIAVRAIGG
jgi:pyroglutamyl-peptidase